MNAKSTLLGLLLSLSIVTTYADTVPSLMSYQGRVTDAAGALIGNATPVNRTVTFRFYTVSTGGTAIYAETQTVTISAGEFSVLIGNGTGVSGSPGPSSPATTPYKSLSDITNAASTTSLYLGITVDDGNGATVDAEIAPRQQLVSGAYALRAKVAETVANGAVSTSMIADSAVTTNQIHASAVTSAKIADGSIATADIGNNVITAAKLDTNSIGLWNTSGANVYRSSGNVGIGQSNPNFPLTFSNTLGDKISLYGNGSNHFGFGIQNGMMQLYTSSSNSDIGFGYGTSSNFHETMRIKGNGNVGIATTNPVAKLDVAGVRFNGTFGRNFFKDSEKSDGNGLRVGSAWGKYGIYAETGAGVLGGKDGASLQNDSLFVSTNGKVGIGNTSPGVPLSFADTVGEKIALYGSNSSEKYGFGISSGTLQIFSSGSGSKVAIGRGSSSSMTEVLNVYGNRKVSVNTSDTSQADLTIGGSLAVVGSMDGRTSYARFRYDNRGVSVDVYNSNHNSGWRTFLYNGDSNLDFYSDARLKKNVEDAEPVLDRVLQLRMRRFQWRDQAEDSVSEFGVIAQEVQPLFPDIISSGLPVGQTEEHLTVGYTAFGTIAIKAIQELKERGDQEKEALLTEIEASTRRLNDELAAKDARIADLEKRLAAIEQMLTAAK
ncbi:tail fiber domain-containing protein [Pelagicoccus sp. SDUM812002]|uniref:tail fiber domain-containing protein n=1 Tax=Pelagicoccus sp. SDUM812002 TaxID=3041266 RepID=UPI0028107E81|nr:tail fiber domain-containing protein [Pelagicoccus sp. SDUM812002]MDQ8187409.1 tail fiber domain-containing protein [Pelagicoccus sp. SDUM812002]